MRVHTICRSVMLSLLPGLGSLVVFLATLFALWKGVDNGYAAVAIVQSGIFAEASRQLVK